MKRAIYPGSFDPVTVGHMDLIVRSNHKLEPSVETVFLTTSLEYSYLSSTIVKEVAFYHGDISKFVPDVVRERIREKMNQKGECR